MMGFVKNLSHSLAYYLLKLSTIVLFFYASNAAAGVVTLAWDASSSPSVRGYRLYYGPASGNYRYNVDVGNYTACTVVVQEGATYYFAVKAYDSTGNESGFSSEVSKPFIKGDLNGDGTADLAGLNSDRPHLLHHQPPHLDQHPRLAHPARRGRSRRRRHRRPRRPQQRRLHLLHHQPPHLDQHPRLAWRSSRGRSRRQWKVIDLVRQSNRVHGSSLASHD